MLTAWGIPDAEHTVAAEGAGHYRRLRLTAPPNGDSPAFRLPVSVTPVWVSVIGESFSHGGGYVSIRHIATEPTKIEWKGLHGVKDAAGAYRPAEGVATDPDEDLIVIDDRRAITLRTDAITADGAGLKLHNESDAAQTVAVQMTW